MMCLLFFFGGVINEYFNIWESYYFELIKEICDGLYVDDLMIGGEIVEFIVVKKVIIIEVFKDVIFIIYKWYFNVLELEIISGLLFEELFYVK